MRWGRCWMVLIHLRVQSCCLRICSCLKFDLKWRLSHALEGISLSCDTVSWANCYSLLECLSLASIHHFFKHGPRSTWENWLLLLFIFLFFQLFLHLQQFPFSSWTPTTSQSTVFVSVNLNHFQILKCLSYYLSSFCFFFHLIHTLVIKIRLDLSQLDNHH